MNKLAVVVTTPPYDNLTTTAINIIKAAIKNRTTIVGVFFYQVGVLNAAKHLSIPSDEFQTSDAWKKLAELHNVPLYLCSTAAEKHGLINEEMIHECFTITGLGELVELASNADRMLQL